MAVIDAPRGLRMLNDQLIQKVDQDKAIRLRMAHGRATRMARGTINKSIPINDVGDHVRAFASLCGA